MKSYDYDAVIYDGMCFCTGCAPKEFTSDRDGHIEKTPITDDDLDPIFADSEWDSYPVCEACGEKHTYVNLTSAGLVSEAEAENAEIFYVPASEFANAQDSGTWHEEYMEGTDWEDAESVKLESEAKAGYYVWCCLPGCVPDSEASGPFKTPSDAAASYLDL